jgi:hypothetical protein
VNRLNAVQASPSNLAGNVDLASDSSDTSDAQEVQSGLLVPAITASVDGLNRRIRVAAARG